MVAASESLSLMSFGKFDEIDDDLVGKILKPQTYQSLQNLLAYGFKDVQESASVKIEVDAIMSPQCSIDCQRELSRESTDAPDDHEDFEEGDFDDANDEDEPRVGKIGVSLLQKSIEKALLQKSIDKAVKHAMKQLDDEEFDDFVEKDPVGSIREVLDIEDHISRRQISSKSHGNYFEDSSWGCFDPEFAQWFVQCPLKPILEDVQETYA
jgi:hypothetical protein